MGVYRALQPPCGHATSIGAARRPEIWARQVTDMEVAVWSREVARRSRRALSEECVICSANHFMEFLASGCVDRFQWSAMCISLAFASGLPRRSSGSEVGLMTTCSDGVVAEPGQVSMTSPASIGELSSSNCDDAGAIQYQEGLFLVVRVACSRLAGSVLRQLRCPCGSATPAQG